RRPADQIGSPDEPAEFLSMATANLKMRSRLPQTIEHDARGKAVRDLAVGGLEIADGDTRARTEKPVRLADVVAAARQQLLHLEALAHRPRALVARPGLHERPAAAQPVGKMSDGERISLGRIVFHDDAEILQHQKRRT